MMVTLQSSGVVVKLSKMDTQYRIAKEMLAAGLGCATVDSLFNPLEVLKVRLQNRNHQQQQQPLNSYPTGKGSQDVVTSSSSRMSGLHKEILTIIRRDGTIGLWMPGLFPTQLRGLLYAGTRIGLYPTVKTFTPTYIHGLHPDGFMNKLLSGGMCGMIGSFVFNPLDLVRIRLQANPSAYPSTLQALTVISRGRITGTRELWRGASVNILRATLLSGTQLSVYDTLKKLLTTSSSPHQPQPWWRLTDGPFAHMCASFLSGSIAQVVIMPVDTMKTKLMLQVSPNGNPRLNQKKGFHLLVQCAKDVYNQSNACSSSVSGEGGRTRNAAISLPSLSRLGNFYRGLVPAVLRQGPCMLVQMPVIEQIRRLFGLDYM